MTDIERLNWMIEHRARVDRWGGRHFVQFPGFDRGPFRDTPRAAIDAAIHEQHCERLPA